MRLIGGPFPGSTTGQTVFSEAQHRSDGRVWVRDHLYDKATGQYLGAQVWEPRIRIHRRVDVDSSQGRIVIYPTPKPTIAERVLSQDG